MTTPRLRKARRRGRHVLLAAALAALVPGGVAHAAERLHADAQLTNRTFASMLQNGDGSAGDDAYRGLVLQHAGQLTSATLYWDRIRPAPGVFDFTEADAIADYATRHDLPLRGHPLIWYFTLPEWVKRLDLTRAQALAFMREHIHTVIRHHQAKYPGLVTEWDVVNEPLDELGRLRPSKWREWIGPDYIDHAFRFAAEVADPGTKLILNEYFLTYAPLGPGGCSSYPKCRSLRALVTRMVRDGVPIDAVGLQGHLSAGLSGFQAPSIGPLMSWVGPLGLSWHLSELDVGIPPTNDRWWRSRQALAYRRVTEACVRDRWCSGITPWALSDRHTWLKDPRWGFGFSFGLPFDEQLRPVPAYFAMRDAFRSTPGAVPYIGDDGGS